ncbi:DddA-like double-stranded DNA deaminase toxin [Micromonospora sp. SH-82]|uniref:DddA-like double-stranded DNA deaminase toxin n=1 Tax=Micromonospora sp. SH-82 TaxID=3132938 RepID=UPI003EC048CD
MRGSAVGEARRLVTAVLHGGQPGPTPAGLEQVLELLAAVLKRSTEAREHAEEALTRARQIGGAQGPVTGGRSDIIRPPTTPDAPTTTTDVPASSEPPPAWLSEAARDLPRQEAKDPTSGVALIGGQRVPMRSGREPATAADLKPAYQLIATTTDHLEAKLAARMRREHLTDAAVVTNNPPCDYTPYGCEKILSRLLPAGTRLTVYVRDDDGQVRHWRTYNGNGKAIA